MTAERWRPAATLPILQARAQALAAVRDFFAERAVLEVQTPVLGRHGVTDPALHPLRVAGGYLQTSTEYHQKRLLAAGMPDNYTLQPVLRGGEEGRLHNPEFTMLEWYRRGWTDAELRVEVSALVDHLLGAGRYHTLGYAEVSQPLSSRERARHDPALHEELAFSRGVDALDSGRYFIVDFPARQAALAAIDPSDANLARRFELVIDGVELANGYQELTDPDELERRLHSEARQREQAQQHPVPVDTDLLAAMRTGFPFCAGVALGFDRLLMLQQGATSVAAVQAFPWQRR